MKTNWIGFAAMGIMVCFMTGSALAQPICNLDMESLVTPMNGSSVQGYAHLCADGSGVQIELVGSGLTAGDVYTAWFVYFDKPSTCNAQPCTGADLSSADPAATVCRLDGLVAKSDGWAYFAGKVKDLKLPSGSMVWVVIFGHGPASGNTKALSRQLMTPQEPALGAPALGTSGDGSLGQSRARTVFQMQ
jgi:hypothetical protein